MHATSDYRRQFVLSLNAHNRWRWFLYDVGMKPIASGFGTYRTYDECVASTRQAIGIAHDAAIWDATHQRWEEGVGVSA
ncbi:hypothetical protein [Noviluteimonas gilva]|uniref:DUF1508 domain-containing protein n=1 Tax=Noviluteimonas gilva TaxID=2682097 RepID=A0A7C9M1U9_9GAMM|nr:hypothetical protein [Lysobacter gilvus]MUV12942.1 hypothetical protein [Lysobacter gilvus]